MDFITLGHRFLTALPSANSTADFSDMPIKLLEAVVPGYSLFANSVQQYLGFDISLAMTCVAFFFIAKRAISFVWVRAYSTFLSRCTSCVHIDGGDELYNTIVQWISVTRPDLSRRSLTARTQYGSIVQYDSDNEEDNEDAEVMARVAIDEKGFFNFNRWAARAPPRYEPSYGCFWFRNPRGIFQFDKTETLIRGPDMSERVECAIDFRCVGFNTTPIKLLLMDIKAWTVRKQNSKTVIRTPTTDRWNLWMKSSERPSRPLDTVILDAEQKARILWDMNEYLHPLSPKWYAARGIPYRRGYLFHGPPGTGKTSLSFSLAGIFGLDIHIINLMDSMITESMLSRLFNNLPKRCIVLFEDIDAAGVKKRNDESDDSESDSEEEKPVKKPKKSKTHKIRQRRIRGREGARSETSEKASTTEQNTGSTDEEATPQAIDSAISSPPKLKTNGHTNGDNTLDTPTTHDSDADADASSSSASSSDSEASSSSSSSSSSATSSTPEHISLDKLARALLTASRRTTSPTPSPPPRRRRRRHRTPTSDTEDVDAKISLSGLLNVIDGVATHEGRIVIMTTNHPEKLDAALIRAGRVDLQIGFSNATRAQCEALFLRMYAAAELPGLNPKAEEKEDVVSEKELQGLAKRFADLLPEKMFAPSDVQGYLLCHRKRPREAVDKVVAWKEQKEKEIADKEKEKSRSSRRKRR